MNVFHAIKTLINDPYLPIWAESCYLGGHCDGFIMLAEERGLVSGQADQLTVMGSSA